MSGQALLACRGEVKSVCTMAGVSPSWSLLSTLAWPCVRRREATCACPSIAATPSGEAPCWSIASTSAPASSRQHTTYIRHREGGRIRRAAQYTHTHRDTEDKGGVFVSSEGAERTHIIHIYIYIYYLENVWTRGHVWTCSCPASAALWSGVMPSRVSSTACKTDTPC